MEAKAPGIKFAGPTSTEYTRCLQLWMTIDMVGVASRGRLREWFSRKVFEGVGSEFIKSSKPK